MKKCTKCGKVKGNCHCEEENDTVAAGTVRSLFGDEAAKDFKAIFGDWF